MKIEIARKEDLEELLEIYKKAREFMKKSGNTTQWGEDKPSKETLERDIENKNLYVVREDREIVGAFALIYGVDKTYLEIDGKWLNDEPYATLHRVASSGKAKGLMKSIIEKIIENGFTHCGIIKVEDGSLREAFQKISKK